MADTLTYRMTYDGEIIFRPASYDPFWGREVPTCYIARTINWEGPPRPDYMAARADLLDHLHVQGVSARRDGEYHHG